MEESGETGSNVPVNPAVTDYIKGYKAVTDDNMKVAAQITNPLINIIGNAIGVLTILAVALVPLTTMLDLLYIGFPAIRPMLNPEYNMQQGGGMAGGMGMPMGGMGMGGYGARGMGMGMGMAQTAAPTSNRPRLVSDEAIACTPQTSQAQPMAGGMGMPMGGMGGMGMGMGAVAPAQPVQTKSFIWEYLKKRTFFIILFVVATILLTSSVLTDCGINIAQLIANIMMKFNDGIGNVSI